MALNPFDPFHTAETSSTAWDAIFRRPLRGGGGSVRVAARKKAEAAEEIDREAEEDFRKDDKVKDPPPPPAPVVRLFNPEWGGTRGYFDEKILLSVEADLPPDISHLTRVTFTLFALKDGESERIGAEDGHIKDGKAEVEMQLWTPQFRDGEGNLVKECGYSFKVKHRYSPEIESEPLKGMDRCGVTVSFIELELLQADGKTPRAGEKYVVTASDGEVHEGVLDKNGRARIEPVADGEATVAFPDLAASGAASPGGSDTQAGQGQVTSPFYLRIRMKPEEAGKMEEKFILSSTDGSFSQTRTADDDLILGDDFIDLRFPDLPTGLDYSLRVESKDAAPYHVFKDVPFAKLDGFAG